MIEWPDLKEAFKDGSAAGEHGQSSLNEALVTEAEAAGIEPQALRDLLDCYVEAGVESISEDGLQNVPAAFFATALSALITGIRAGRADAVRLAEEMSRE